MNANARSVFFCSREAAPALRDGGGVIVNNASNAGIQGFKGCAVYSASKGAVVSLTRAMAMELAPEIRRFLSGHRGGRKPRFRNRINVWPVAR